MHAQKFTETYYMNATLVLKNTELLESFYCILQQRLLSNSL